MNKRKFDSDAFSHPRIVKKPKEYDSDEENKDPYYDDDEENHNNELQEDLGMLQTEFRMKRDLVGYQSLYPALAKPNEQQIIHDIGWCQEQKDDTAQEYRERLHRIRVLLDRSERVARWWHDGERWRIEISRVVHRRTQDLDNLADTIREFRHLVYLYATTEMDYQTAITELRAKIESEWKRLAGAMSL
jgi:hypothetical protein